MPIAITTVDAFADRPFAGNPAAVCVVPREVSAAWMQKVAREMNLSETAFLRKKADAHELRWFTPTVEVALCGHATLASAHVLWEQGLLARDQVAQFDTKSGRLTATWMGGDIELDFPSKAVRAAEPPPGLLDALGCSSPFVGANGMDLLVEVATESELRALKPDFGSLAKIPVRGVIVTSRSADFDFVSRFFAPASGVDEDPATGSAHSAALGPFWGERLSKSTMVGYQASERGGIVRVRLEGNRVKLGGQAVTVLRGELLADPE